MPGQILADAGLTDVDAEFEQFARIVSRSPKLVLAGQHANQLANFFRHRRVARLAVTNFQRQNRAKPRRV